MLKEINIEELYNNELSFNELKELMEEIPYYDVHLKNDAAYSREFILWREI